MLIAAFFIIAKLRRNLDNLRQVNGSQKMDTKLFSTKKK
jgi:hypothetical protein